MYNDHKTFSLSKIDLFLQYEYDHMVHTCFLIHFFHFFPYTYPVKLVSWKLVPSLNATGRCVLFIVKPVGNERGDRHYSMCVEKN